MATTSTHQRVTEHTNVLGTGTYYLGHALDGRTPGPFATAEDALAAVDRLDAEQLEQLRTLANEARADHDASLTAAVSHPEDDELLDAHLIALEWLKRCTADLGDALTRLGHPYTEQDTTEVAR